MYVMEYRKNGTPFSCPKFRKDVIPMPRQEPQERSPPHKYHVEIPPVTGWQKSSLFGLTTLYLSEWDLSRVRSTTPALDKSQADRYSPRS